MSGPGTLEILLLGPLEVRRDGAVVRIGGAKPRMLLADLALSVGVAVSVDRIIDDLWGERPPKSAEHGVEVHVSKLRTHVGEGVVVTRNPGYALEIDPDRIDITRFTELSARGPEEPTSSWLRSACRSRARTTCFVPPGAHST
jgi:DNA-binding SARP family transcriptional activator